MHFLLFNTRLVCECFQQTKDKFRYFAVGKNGHCFAGGEFQEKTEQSSECVGPAEHQQGGLESAEYVYQIKADAATRKQRFFSLTVLECLRGFEMNSYSINNDGIIIFGSGSVLFFRK